MIIFINTYNKIAKRDKKKTKKQEKEKIAMIVKKNDFLKKKIAKMLFWILYLIIIKILIPKLIKNSL